MTKTCVPGRYVSLVLRWKTGKRTVRPVDIIVPTSWSKSQTLAYVRAAHEEQTVRITSWGEKFERWIANGA